MNIKHYELFRHKYYIVHEIISKYFVKATFKDFFLQLICQMVNQKKKKN